MRSEELVAALVAIDSVNPDLVPGGAGEAEIADFVADRLREAGLEVELDDAAPGRPNVVAVARGTGGGASLMLNAHMDTVGVEGMEHPFEPAIPPGWVPARCPVIRISMQPGPSCSSESHCSGTALR